MRVAHGQGAPAFNVESCGSGFYPLQWACMIAVGCLLANEQLLRFQDTGEDWRNSAPRTGGVENSRKKVAKRA